MVSFFEGLLKPRFDPDLIIHQNFIQMKRSILLFVSLLMTVTLLSQSHGKFRNDLWVYKTSPGLLLDGSGAFINFNNSDLLLTQSTNTLTLSGGNLALGTNSLTLTGSIGATGSRVTKGWFTNLEITNLPTINGANLSALYTSGNISIGTNSLLMTGSIAATGNRVTKGWFTDIESTNVPTVGGTSILAQPNITTALGVGTAAPLHRVSVLATRATKLYGINIVESDVNKNRSSAAQATDSSSFSIKFSYTGSPTLALASKAGATLFAVDSTKITVDGLQMAKIFTIVKTIGGVGVASCDFNFATAANTNEQIIDLGAIVPAKARILDINTYTNNVFTGATTLVAETGVTSSGNEYITSASIYASNAITATAAGGTFIAAPSASALHVYVSATPGANWASVTAGKVTVNVTYIAY
jgi:hypothetical protein